MNLNSCCLKALKHGETVCPVCGTYVLAAISQMEKDGQLKLMFDKQKQLVVQFKENVK
ncbi:MAG: hypothetical protein IKT32_02180 [Clostridia bacterium]|nr:hypothetical protein [Clostridia bacterium]